MNAAHVKAAVMCWLRFKRQYYYVATECGTNSADIIASDGSNLVEIEVKISMSDFKRDFYKHKHKEYEEDKLRKSLTRAYSWTPNKFYFAVPYELYDEVTKYVDSYHDGQYKHYGIMSVSANRRIDDSVRVLRRAGAIHDGTAKPHILKSILHRMGSDLCHLHMHNTQDKNLDEVKAISATFAEPLSPDTELE